MLKYILMGTVACVLFQSAVCEAQKLSFGAVEPVSVMKPFEVKSADRQALEKAVELHNLIVQLRQLDYMKTQLTMAHQLTDRQSKRLTALENCSVRKLSDQFKDPSAVWGKMKETYAEKEKGLTLAVNASDKVTPEQKADYENYMATGELSDYMVSELLAPWQIGQEIVKDVYQNQDQWGERKDKDAPSFPLWKDQKYQFDQEWNQFYTELNMMAGLPPTGRPVIADDVRYDYAKSDKVLAAHQDYLKLVGAKNPAILATAAVQFKTPPMPPHPLPPKDEMVVYLEAPTPEKRVYPALPEPWQKYQKNGFQNINPDGEMAQDFKSGLELKESAKTSGKQTNRLVAYAGLKQATDSSQNVERLYTDKANLTVIDLRRRIKGFIDIPDDIKLFDDEQRVEVIQKLLQKQDELIRTAQAAFAERQAADERTYEVHDVALEEIEDFKDLKRFDAESYKTLMAPPPESAYQEDKNLLDALNKDKEARVFINEISAPNVDKMLKENKATEAFTQVRQEWDKLMAADVLVPIDDTCLNGGVEQ